MRRRMTGTVQALVLPQSEALLVAKESTLESAVEVSGTINKRPEKNVSAGKQNGDIELLIEGMAVLNGATSLDLLVADLDMPHLSGDEMVRLPAGELAAYGATAALITVPPRPRICCSGKNTTPIA